MHHIKLNIAVIEFSLTGDSLIHTYSYHGRWKKIIANKTFDTCTETPRFTQFQSTWSDY